MSPARVVRHGQPEPSSLVIVASSMTWPAGAAVAPRKSAAYWLNGGATSSPTRDSAPPTAYAVIRTATGARARTTPARNGAERRMRTHQLSFSGGAAARLDNEASRPGGGSGAVTVDMRDFSSRC